MSIQKKSLISTLKTAKKANVASDPKGEKVSSMKFASTRAVSMKKAVSSKMMKSAKNLSGRSVGHSKATFKMVS